MPFLVHLFRRFPVQGVISYNAGPTPSRSVYRSSAEPTEIDQ